MVSADRWAHPLPLGPGVATATLFGLCCLPGSGRGHLVLGVQAGALEGFPPPCACADRVFRGPRAARACCAVPGWRWQPFCFFSSLLLGPVCLSLGFPAPLLSLLLLQWQITASRLAKAQNLCPLPCRLRSAWVSGRSWALVFRPPCSAAWSLPG